MMKPLPFLVVLLLLASCALNGDLKGLYSYYEETRAEGPDLIASPDSSAICALQSTETPKVYPITGKELLACIGREETVVFLWQPNCHSQYCYSPSTLQAMCDQKQIELFIVSEYYDFAKMSLKWSIERPIYGIDIYHYETDFTKKYVSRFLTDLTGISEHTGSFLRFRDGTFIESFVSADEL